MHQLGELKYGVELEDFHLTVDTADQDFDLKQSMENLDSFSEAYSYNIVKQVGTNAPCTLKIGCFSDHGSYGFLWRS
jgi:hypothetical protein